MSSREKQRNYSSPVGVGTHYRHLLEFVNDHTRLHQLAEAMEISSHHVRKDSCDQWTIFGKAGQIQTAGKDSFLLHVQAPTRRKWGAVKRKATSVGWDVAQDGDQEGTLILTLPDKERAKLLRSLLGLRIRRGSPEEPPLNSTVSLR